MTKLTETRPGMSLEKGKLCSMLKIRLIFPLLKFVIIAILSAMASETLSLFILASKDII